MTISSIVVIPEQVLKGLQTHLLRKHRVEEAAFLYAHHTPNGFEYIEWFPVPSHGFLNRSTYRLELTDAMRGVVIKRAHDLGASIVELHSHVSYLPASFSPTDLAGLDAFVPHVMWRLKGKPYVAIVMAVGSFDGFAWLSNPKTPQRLDGIHSGARTLVPTGLSSFPGEAQ